MLLIVEIALTIFLCIRFHKAGKSWALGLLPLAIALGAGFVFGFMLALNGVTSVSALSTLWIDILLIIAQIVLLITTKRK